MPVKVTFPADKVHTELELPAIDRLTVAVDVEVAETV